MLRKQDHNTYSFVAADVAATGLAAGTVVTPRNTTSGEVFITDLENQVLAAYPATGSVRIIQSLGVNKPLKIVDIRDVENAKVSWRQYSPAVQKVVAIGWNGTSGSLPTASNTSFHVRLMKRDNDAANRSHAQTGIFGQYKTDSSATQQEVAYGLTLQLAKNISLEANSAALNQANYVRATIISNATILAGTVGTAAAFYGSTLLQLTAPPVAGLVVGNEIQILGDSYIVSAIDLVNNILTLNTPYRGDDVSSVPVDDAYGTPATNYGIRLEGIRNKFIVTSFSDYYSNNFDVYFSDSLIKVTVLAESYDGLGEYEQVSMNEHMSWGFIGQNHMMSTPSIARESQTVPFATYGIMEIRWADQVKTMLSTGNSKGSILLYFELANTNPDTLTALNGGGLLLAQFIANTGLAAAGLIATSLDE